MDSERFDAWIRSLLGVTSRRTTLRVLMSAALLAPLAPSGLPDVAAKKHHHKKKHKKHKKHGGGGGGGGCPAGQTDCGNGQCVDLATDPNNCGACGNVCAGIGCQNGACLCDFGEDDDCPSGCVCLEVDLDNGVCVPPPTACTVDQTLCSGDDDCPLGSICLNCGFQAPSRCSNPCNPS